MRSRTFLSNESSYSLHITLAICTFIDVDISRASNIAVDHCARFRFTCPVDRTARITRSRQDLIRLVRILPRIVQSRIGFSHTLVHARDDGGDGDDHRRVQSLENFSDRSFNAIFKFNALIKEMLYSF